MKVTKLARFRIAMGAGILLAVVVVGGVGWAFLQQLTLAEELRGEIRELERAVATQEVHQNYLTATLTYVHSDDYVEEWAREEAKMVRPGEVLVIPVARSEGPDPAVTPTVEPEDVAPVPESRPFWVVWWEAIVGP